MTSGSSRLAFILAIFAFLATAEYHLMSWAITPRALRGNDEGDREKNFFLSVKGLETTIISDNRKIRLSVGSVMIVRRKYLVFSIQPLNEILFDNFYLDYFKRPQDQSIFPLNDIRGAFVAAEHKEGKPSSGLFDLKTGVITRGVIRRFILTIYEEDGIRTVVRSEKAEMDFKHNKIRLENASIEQHDFKRVTQSSEAVLKNSDGTVYIPGEYMIFHPEGVLKGRGVKIRL